MVEGGLRIVVFPWLGFGHMMPFLELSKSFAKRGHHVSFISTPRNIKRLPKLPPNLHIDLISFPLPRVAGLPDTAEATSDLQYSEVQYLKTAFDLLSHPFSDFIKRSHPKPDWIIYDFPHYWIPEIAADAVVKCAFFSVFSAATIAFLKPPPPLDDEHEHDQSRKTPEEFTVPGPWVPFPTKVALRPREAQRFFAYSRMPNASGVTDNYRYVRSFNNCDVVAVRSSMEIEPEWVRLLQQQTPKKPVVPVGLLPPPAPEQRGEDDEKIMEWLDKQTRPRSVIYVAFGSEAMLSEEEVKRVAAGLELANLPFLWSLRMPDRSELNKEEILPEGFEERTKDYGIVIKGWIPQLKVLAHESIGGFFFHAGWSSVIEALQFGHPFLFFPKSLDNPIIARTLEEQGIGVELERSEVEGPFTSEGLAKHLKLIMVEEEGEPYRKKAKEMKEAFADKECHEKYIDDFVDLLRSHRNQKV